MEVGCYAAYYQHVRGVDGERWNGSNVQRWDGKVDETSEEVRNEEGEQLVPVHCVPNDRLGHEWGSVQLDRDEDCQQEQAVRHNPSSVCNVDLHVFFGGWYRGMAIGKKRKRVLKQQQQQ
eukprot:GEZU01021917.1.p1 GENE.GEZU01021917.1~~GEZU01021917.1.p1  ORF type:complete len:120 (+),score=4.72 GEZU01021917.1:380-739(+)